MMRRDEFWTCLATGVCTGSLLGAPSNSEKRIVVVVDRRIPALNQASDTVCSQLRDNDFGVVEIVQGARRDLWRRSVGADLVVAVGVNALRDALQGTSLPVLATMGLETQYRSVSIASESRVVAAVSVDVPFATLLPNARAIFPDARRIGVLRRRVRIPTLADLAAEAEEAGLELRLAECDGPEDLVSGFQSLQSTTDVVWCPPSSGLYTRATVKPLILSSLRARVPIIGFSRGLVRAGAAAGVVLDFARVGQQTANLVAEYLLSGEQVPTRQPDGFRLLANRRVMRILGLKFPGGDELEIEQID